MLNALGCLILQAQYSLKPKRLLAGLLLGVDILAVSLCPVLAQEEVNRTDTDTAISTLDTSTISSKLTSGEVLDNGVYLFGESVKPGQVQQEYFVFELQNEKVMGAFYMPYSSFDCFHGSFKAGELDLTIVSSYDEAAYPYSVKLKDYQLVSSISSSDQRILNTCKTVYQAKLGN